jgi:glycosyltransferase involved in cell wall biosynthesis
MDPLVIIGVPVYNGEAYLEECLESIRVQSYRNWECHVINNRSTDQSPVIAEAFEKKDPRFKVFTNDEFVDMIVNFNNTTKHVPEEADYFKVVCADDWLYPDYLKRMVALMEAHPQAGIALSFRLDHLRVGCAGLNIYEGPLFNGRQVLMRELRATLNVTGSETTALYRIETLRKLGNYPTIFTPDSYNFDTSLAYDLLNISDLVFDFQVLSYTRRHEDTFTSKYKDRFQTTINAREYELNRFKKQYPELISEYKGVRYRYGKEMLKKKLRRDREFLRWHKKWLQAERRFTTGELFNIAFRAFFGKLLFWKKEDKV